MRKKRTAQMSIFDLFEEHEIGKELAGMSHLLDDHLEVLDWVAEDLRGKAVKETGRSGMTVESVVRCAILKQYRQLTYKELSFHLSDSMSFRAFSRLGLHLYPCRSALQAVISSIREETWERINRRLLMTADQEKIERGRKVRVDSTVTETMIHEPTDSTLLEDGVRVMNRLMGEVADLSDLAFFEFQNHLRAVRKRTRAIRSVRGQEKRANLYKELIRYTERTLGYMQTAKTVLSGIADIDWINRAEHFSGLVQRAVDQTRRRVFLGETVAATEKIVSLFEDHTDIIVKDRRETHFGHKLNMTSGKSGMILDVVIESGNPADSERFLPMIKRQIDIYLRPPLQVAGDGGYASKNNLTEVKNLGVRDVCFHKKRGLEITDMVKSHWVYRQLRNFRAGIEGNISCLKRAYGLTRCTWKGLAHFKTYVWSSVVAYNLALFGRLRTEPA